MNKQFPLLLLAVTLAVLTACHHPDEILSNSTSTFIADDLVAESDLSDDIHPNGRIKGAPLLEDIYTKDENLDFGNIEFTDELVRGLQQQLKVLKYQRKKNIRQMGDLEIDYQKLETAIDNLLEMAQNSSRPASNQIVPYLLKGKDGRGNTYFTGYFTPVLRVKKQPDATYKYPIFARPRDWQGALPSRRQIDGDGVLSGKGLELAYASNLVDIYFMQVQGSGIVEFPDGRQQLLAYDGSNGHSYNSIGKYMVENNIAREDQVSLKGIRNFFIENPELMKEVLFVNSSYVFFTPQNSNPQGAGMVPLTTSHSIAVDKRYIPLGSCLLAKVPVIKHNKVVRHEFRVLLAQDTGGAIKGPGRVDLYTGVGETGRKRASALHHYGNLWLLMPKEAQPLAANL